MYVVFKCHAPECTAATVLPKDIAEGMAKVLMEEPYEFSEYDFTYEEITYEESEVLRKFHLMNTGPGMDIFDAARELYTLGELLK